MITMVEPGRRNGKWAENAIRAAEYLKHYCDEQDDCTICVFAFNTDTPEMYCELNDYPCDWKIPSKVNMRGGKNELRAECKGTT